MYPIPVLSPFLFIPSLYASFFKFGGFLIYLSWLQIQMCSFHFSHRKIQRKFTFNSLENTVLPVAMTAKMAYFSATRNRRCGKCKGCRMDMCGTCINCRDMKKYGGTGRNKKACGKKVCTASWALTETAGSALFQTQTSPPLSKQSPSSLAQSPQTQSSSLPQTSPHCSLRWLLSTLYTPGCPVLIF